MTEIRDWRRYRVKYDYNYFAPLPSTTAWVEMALTKKTLILVHQCRIVLSPTDHVRPIMNYLHAMGVYDYMFDGCGVAVSASLTTSEIDVVKKWKGVVDVVVKTYSPDIELLSSHINIVREHKVQAKDKKSEEENEKARLKLLESMESLSHELGLDPTGLDASAVYVGMDSFGRTIDKILNPNKED